MKKILLIALAAVVVVGGGVLAVRHYQTYKTNKQRSDAIAAHQAEVEQQEQAQKLAQAVEDFQLQHTECLKGKAIYDTLPAVTKAKVQAPNCNVGITR